MYHRNTDAWMKDAGLMASEQETFDKLLDRAYLGTQVDRASARLTESELDYVAAELKNPYTRVDKYTLIQILGYSQAHGHRPLMEHFLDEAQDPKLARVALQMLCVNWGLTGDYTGALLRFIQGVAWDPEDEARISAINVAGNYLRRAENIDLLRAILTVFEDAAESRSLRQIAYIGLGRAMGRSYAEIPQASDDFDPIKDLDPALIQAVRKRLLKLI